MPLPRVAKFIAMTPLLSPFADTQRAGPFPETSLQIRKYADSKMNCISRKNRSDPLDRAGTPIAGIHCAPASDLAVLCFDGFLPIAQGVVRIASWTTDTTGMVVIATFAFGKCTQNHVSTSDMDLTGRSHSGSLANRVDRCATDGRRRTVVQDGPGQGAVRDDATTTNISCRVVIRAFADHLRRHVCHRRATACARRPGIARRQSPRRGAASPRHADACRLG